MKKWIYAILCCVLLFTACSKKSIDQVDKAGSYRIYYIDSKSSGIVSEVYTPVASSKEALIDELLTKMKTDPQNISYRKGVPDTVVIKSFEINEKETTLTINFDSTYENLKGIPETLCRATIVKTLSQVSGVEYIKFIVNGQPLIDANGVQIGLMTADDFLEKTGTEMNYKAVLYFASENGKSLIPTDAVIYYTGTSSIEEMVINQLINGPTEIGKGSTIPDGTVLLNITTKEGICYVNFNEKFTESVQDVSDTVTVYSIVNSLVELPNINKVQFMINSTVLDSYRDVPSTNGFFERNLEIIEEGSR